MEYPQYVFIGNWAFCLISYTHPKRYYDPEDNFYLDIEERDGKLYAIHPTNTFLNGKEIHAITKKQYEDFVNLGNDDFLYTGFTL